MKSSTISLDVRALFEPITKKLGVEPSPSAWRSVTDKLSQGRAHQIKEKIYEAGHWCFSQPEVACLLSSLTGEDDKKHVEDGGEQVHGSGVTPWGEVEIDITDSYSG